MMTTGFPRDTPYRGSPVSWFLRSLADRDTHRGKWSPVTRSVFAACGAEFVPLRLQRTRITLPGEPSDPAQVCQACKQAAGTD